jgi:hypothetical protein
VVCSSFLSFIISNPCSFSVALSGNTALVGAPFDDARGEDSGSAYIFSRPNSSNVLSLTFSGLNPVYKVGETLKVDLLTTGNLANPCSRSHAPRSSLYTNSFWTRRPR